jgi:hypothetical protein
MVRRNGRTLADSPASAEKGEHRLQFQQGFSSAALFIKGTSIRRIVVRPKAEGNRVRQVGNTEAGACYPPVTWAVRKADTRGEEHPMQILPIPAWAPGAVDQRQTASDGSASCCGQRRLRERQVQRRKAVIPFMEGTRLLPAQAGIDGQLLGGAEGVRSESAGVVHCAQGCVWLLRTARRGESQHIAGEAVRSRGARTARLRGGVAGVERNLEETRRPADMQIVSANMTLFRNRQNLSRCKTMAIQPAIRVGVFPTHGLAGFSL